MLSDDELDAIAEAHATEGSRRSPGLVETGHRVVVVREFELDEPAGVYYTERLEPPDEEFILLGGAGFFVYRNSGIIHVFGSSEFYDVARPLTPNEQFDTPSVVRSLLKTADPTLDPSLPLMPRGSKSASREPLSRASRKWWQLWK